MTSTEKTAQEYQAQALLSQLNRTERAKAILKKTDSRLPFYLLVLLGTGVCNFLINSAAYTAPLSVRVLIVTAFITAAIGAVENFMMRRKLDAAIELLLIQEQRHTRE